MSFLCLICTFFAILLLPLPEGGWKKPWVELAHAHLASLHHPLVSEEMGSLGWARGCSSRRRPYGRWSLPPEDRVSGELAKKAAVPPNTRRLKYFFLYLGTSVGVNIKVAAEAVQPKDRSDKAGEGGKCSSDSFQLSAKMRLEHSAGVRERVGSSGPTQKSALIAYLSIFSSQ